MATASQPSGHISKRQYQPSITSYLSRSNTADILRASRSPLSPPLPAETQASLLSVGMRIRKSVPEGYKTHKTLGTDGFPFPSTAPAAPPRPTPRYENSSRELQPFCGLHKVGGWAAQPPPSSAPAAVGGSDADDEGEEEVPDLSFTQSTVPSTQSSFRSGISAAAGAGNKRSYEEEMEEELDAFFDKVDANERATAPARRIAKPKSTLRKAATDGMLVFGTGGEDFEEAAFLSPMDVDER